MNLGKETKLTMKETLIVLGFFIGVLLPVRLVFYNLVSEYWVGNFGVLSLMLIIILYLSYKQKLGYIGRLIIKRLNHIRHSRITKFFVIFQGILIIILGVICAGFMFGLNEPDTLIFETALKEKGVEKIDDLMNHPDAELSFNEWLLGFFGLAILPIINFGMYSSLMHVIDDLSGGWISHFTTIFFIESVEMFVVIVYFRFIRKGDLDE